jgi:hypothetical protein
MGAPVLLLVSGPMGSGKTTLAEALAARTGMTLVSSDRIRKELAAAQARPLRDRSGFAEGLYTAAWTERTYDALFARGEEALAHGASAILDASFSRRAPRRRAFALAKRLGAEPVLIECVAPDALALARLDAREREGASLSDGRAELYAQQKAAFEAISEIAARRHFRVNTDRPVDSIVTELLGVPALRPPEPLFTLPPAEESARAEVPARSAPGKRGKRADGV